jgi:hypothetical protein
MVPPDKPINRLVVGEHVLQRIGLAFDPEAVLARHVSGDAVRGRLAGVAITVSSSGAATGRWPSLKRR